MTACSPCSPPLGTSRPARIGSTRSSGTACACSPTSSTALRLVTTEGQDVTAYFPELAGLTHLVPDVVLDGKIVLLARGVPSFAALAARMRGVARPGRTRTLMLFDMLRLYGVELRDRPQDERRGTLERLDLERTPGVALSPVYTDGPRWLQGRPHAARPAG